MNNMTLTLLATAAMGAVSIGSASAMPMSNMNGLGSSLVQDVRVVCNRNGQCYNTRSSYRSGRYYRGRGYYGNHYGYHSGPRFGFGPFGIW
jgi:hypothetical protein